MKLSSISFVFLLAFFFILLFVMTQGNEESNELVVAGSANLTDAGKSDHDCEKSNSTDKCSSEGVLQGGGGSEESLFENEDYIYTQSLNP